MFVETAQQCRCIRIVHAMGQPLQLTLIDRQFVRLLIVEQLKRMLDCPQEHITGTQVSIPDRTDQTKLGQPHKRIQRIGTQNARLTFPVNQLQALDEEFHIANRTDSQFDLGIQFSPLTKAKLNTFFHLLNTAANNHR